jgi:hypothetical protein
VRLVHALHGHMATLAHAAWPAWVPPPFLFFLHLPHLEISWAGPKRKPWTAQFSPAHFSYLNSCKIAEKPEMFKSK